MNRAKEINDFLKYFAVLYKENPNLEITSDTFYSKLTTYGLTKEEIQKKQERTISSLYFQDWINYFKGNRNLNVYHTQQQNRFLQFNNGNFGNYEHYKLYISLPEDKMGECVKKIFKFIADNRIETLSKVADCVRSDSVVLRIAKEEDARKVINMINTDPTIASVCKPTNPFLHKNGVVGMAYDRYLSFNGMLSFMLEKYFKEKRSSNKLDSVSLIDFKNYIIRVDNDLFSVFGNKEKLTQFMSDPYIQDEINDLYWLEKTSTLSNIKDVLDIMTIELDTNKTTEDYFRGVNTCMDPNHQQTNQMRINNILKGEQQVINPQTIINDYIAYANRKYHHITLTAKYLQRYIDNDQFAITRDIVEPYQEGFRILFAKHVTRQKLYEITEGNPLNYIIKLNSNLLDMDEKNVDKYKIFKDACNATLNRYGYTQLIEALNDGMAGNYSRFTNGNSAGYRDRLIKYVDNETFTMYARDMLEKLESKQQEGGRGGR